jgi:hypothetical protein
LRDPRGVERPARCVVEAGVIRASTDRLIECEAHRDARNCAGDGYLYDGGRAVEPYVGEAVQ